VLQETFRHFWAQKPKVNGCQMPDLLPGRNSAGFPGILTVAQSVGIAIFQAYW
jgi:hypothetical protein